MLWSKRQTYFIEEFENETFWSELIERLADRDMLQTFDEDEILEMTTEERFKAHFDFTEKYEGEFEEHGIDRLEINE